MPAAGLGKLGEVHSAVSVLAKATLLSFTLGAHTSDSLGEARRQLLRVKASRRENSRQPKVKIQDETSEQARTTGFSG